jgi:predicted alpha-1,2-mannosidase
MKHKLFLLIFFAITFGNGIAIATDYSHQVNTLIGTKGAGLTSGYTYPGATYPFGMVQFTPSYFSKKSGFVINQLSGAGCEHMGNFPTFPIKGKLKSSPNNIVDCRINISKENGHAGYYEAMVQDDIKAMLTVTERTGMAKYIYPTEQDYGTIIIGGGIAATPTRQAAIAITAPNRCEGYAEGGYFCGIRTPYKVYFVAEFDADAIEQGTWKGDRLKRNTSFAEGEYSGVYFTFDLSKRKDIQYKIGISYVSVENARENLKQENPSWDFSQIQKQAENKWNYYLGKIEVKGSNSDRITQFYTHLYHALIHPNICSDVNGEYMGADFKVHQTQTKCYTSFSNWDTYRTQIQLLSMLDPELVSDIVLSLRQFAEQSGGSFPRWVLANIETGVMQGDPTSILVSNAYAFGARNYDPKPLLMIMRKGAEVSGAKSQDIETRPGSKQYLEKGYYNASIQLEYNSADFAIAQFALHAVGDEFLSWQYMHSAQSWKNLFNPKTGWLQSRNEDGSWKPLSEDFRESTYNNYFWMVPFNFKGLLNIIKGKKEGEKRLDSLFRRLDANYINDWYACGNEPSFGIPWAYNWVGRPYKCQNIVRKILTEQYSSKENGLPGNDDLGAMGAWYVFASIGLYPEIPGVGGFAIHSPIFSHIKIYLKNGTLQINGGSEDNAYIQALKLNGKSYDSSWVNWDNICDGGTIEYQLSDKPNLIWGTSVEPPSYSNFE